MNSTGAMTVPVVSLAGVNTKIAGILHSIGISTVADLATSSIFAVAADIEKASRPILLNERSCAVPFFHLDLIDQDARHIPVERLASQPVGVIRSIGKALSLKMESEMGIATVGDLGKWPPYLEAKQLLSASLGGSETDIAEDPEMPSYLVPGVGQYPTERVQYDVIVLDKILRREPPPSGPPPLTHVPENSPDGVYSEPLRSLETDFTPLDVSERSADGFTDPALGAVLTYNQSWYTLGLTLGHLLHSVALSPGETTRIAVVDWNRQQKASAAETIDESEALSAQFTHNRAISEVTQAVASEAQTGFSQATNTEGTYSFGSGSGAAGEIMGFFGVAGASIGNSAGFSKSTSFATSTGRRDLRAEMTQNICDRTQQAANSVRNRRASIVREVAQKESETLSTRAITNFNHMHALTIQYYEVVQLYRTVVELAKVTRCLLLPMKLLDFGNIDLVRRFGSILASAALLPQVRDGLLSIVGLMPAAACSQAEPPVESSREAKIVVNGVGGQDDEGWLQAAQAATGLSFNASSADLWRLPSDTRISGWTISCGEMLELEKAVKIVTVERADGTVESGAVRRGRVGAGWECDRQLLLAQTGDLPLASFRSFSVTWGNIEQPLLPGPQSGRHLEIEFWLTTGGKSFRYRHRLAGGQPNETTRVVVISAVPSAAVASHAGDAPSAVASPSAAAMTHLRENSLYYSQAIWKSMSSAALMAQLRNYAFRGRPLSEVVDCTPIAAVGNYVAFRFYGTDDDQWQEFLEKHPDLDIDDPAKRVHQEEIVPIPSGGVFAEAVLGRANAAEKLDITRFWNWQDSPIPITAPEIAPLQAASRAQAEDITPGQLGQPVLNIVNAPAVPDPTGMAAVLSAISNGSMFRDMSYAAQTIAAATEALKAGFAAAGHSEEIAAQYAQEAANLMAGKTGSSGNAGKSGGSSAAASPNASTLGAKYNAAEKLDREQQKAGTSGSTSSSSSDQPGTGTKQGTEGGSTRRDQILGTSQSAASEYTPAISNAAASDNIWKTFLSPNLVFGIDVSRHQGNNVDWNLAKADGIDFAFIKATQADFADTCFARNWSNSREAGVIAGAYHYFIAAKDVSAQADAYFRTVGTRRNGQLPPVIDVETMANGTWDATGKVFTPAGGLAQADIVTRLRELVDAIEGFYNVRPIIYTSRWDWAAMTGNAEEFGDYPLWVANWPRSNPAAPRPAANWGAEIPDTPIDPTLPSGWAGWYFWQLDYMGRIKGIGNNMVNVDINVFQGSFTDLVAFAGWKMEYI